MPTTTHPIEQLEQIATEFHHWSNEYKNEREQGGTRRTIEKRLEELDSHFNNLLSHWVNNEPKREAWHEYLHHNGPRPDDDITQYPPIYIGQSPSGSELQIRPNDQGAYDILIDGVRADRINSEISFPQSAPIRLLDQEWSETTNTHDAALEALRRYCAAGDGKVVAPWEWARVLYGDGLIDINFSLTSRGRRVLNR